MVIRDAPAYGKLARPCVQNTFVELLYSRSAFPDLPIGPAMHAVGREEFNDMLRVARDQSGDVHTWHLRRRRDHGPILGFSKVTTGLIHFGVPSQCAGARHTQDQSDEARQRQPAPNGSNAAKMGLGHLL